MNLLKALEAIKPQMAEAAQKVLDRWEQDEEGYDEELGGGGACDAIADAMRDVVAQHVPEAEFEDGGHDGDDHAYFVAYDDQKAYAVDIPPGAYETGGGFSWKKLPGVVLTGDDVEVWEVDRDLLLGW